MNNDMTPEQRTNLAASQLWHRVRACGARHGNLITQNLVDDITDLLKAHRRECKMRGIDFPEMVCLVVPEVGAIEIIRRDSTREALQIHVVNLTVKYPAIRPEHIAAALQRAFPDFRPGAIDVRRRAPITIEQPGHA